MATRGTVCERQGQAQRTPAGAHRRSQASVTYATRCQRLTQPAPPRQRRTPAYERRETALPRKKCEQRAYPPSQSRGFKRRASPRFSEGPQPRQGFRLRSAPPSSPPPSSPPPQARHNAILKTPSQPLPVPQRQPQTSQTTDEPYGTLEVAHPPRRFVASICPKGVLAPPATYHTSFASSDVVPSTLTVRRISLPIAFAPRPQAVRHA